MSTPETTRWRVVTEIDGRATNTKIMCGGVCVARTQRMFGRPHTTDDEAEANAILIVELVNKHFEGQANG